MNLVRRYLKREFNTLPRVELSPSGKGSAEQFVRERYPREVKEFRRRANHGTAALVVVIDADTRTVDQRLTELESALTKADLPKRQSTEAIALLVPKRNIETWILCLTGDPIDEET